jgi:secondary thiamine-phosphate synthase enzyme
VIRQQVNQNGLLTHMRTVESPMRICNFQISLETTNAPEFIDITDQVLDSIVESNITMGNVLVYSKHTTAAIKINEMEPLLLEDLARTLEHIAPRDADYRHNDFTVRTVNMNEDECPNGHAHCQHLTLGTSETVPIIDGAVQLGTYQRVFFIELDHPRQREFLIQVMGY